MSCEVLKAAGWQERVGADPEIGADLGHSKALAVWPKDYSHMGFSMNSVESRKSE